jgi:hypothetical protein
MKLGWLAFAGLSLACGGTEIGNPGKSSTALQQVAYSNSADVSIGPSAAALQVTDVWLKLSSVTFADKDNTVFGVVPVPSACNLLARETCLPPPDFEAPGVCQVILEFNADVPLPEDAPPDFTGATVWIGGKRADGTPFVFAADAQQSSRLLNADGFDLADHPSLVLGTNLGEWVNGTDLVGAEPDADGVIRVDGMSSPELAAVIAARVPWAFDLYEDVDADAALSDEELGSPLASP